MTATTSNLATRPRQAAAAQIRRVVMAGGPILGSVFSRWNDFVDAGQLGPSAESVTGRHTGARI